MGKTLKQKASALPNEKHEKEVSALERKIQHLEDYSHRQAVRLKLAERELEDAESRIEFCSHFDKPPRLKSVERRPRHKSRSTASAIISLGDWHVEERVDAKVCSGLNHFDLDIAEKRIHTTFERAVEQLETEQQISNIQEIVLGFLGDHITGAIHEELLESNYLSPCEASLFAQEGMMWGIAYLLKNTSLPIRVVTCNGNHGRTTQRKRISTSHKNSYEWLTYQQTSKFYRNEPRVWWQIGTGYHNYLDVQGKVVRFHHGDAIKYQGGVGGITIPVLKAISSWDRAKHADLDIFQHWHQQLFHRKFIAGNCLIGYNAYALEIKADYSPPSQTLVVIDKNRPAWTCAKEIYCD